jgi:O-antigen ligase
MASPVSMPLNLAAPQEADQTFTPWTVDRVADTPSRGIAYGLALLFLAIYLIRPHDWVPGFAGFNIVRPIMVAWIGIMVLQGSMSPLKGLFRTPQDWAVLFLYSYVAWTAPSEAGATKGFLSLIVFYFLTVQTLSNIETLYGYIKLWCSCLVILAGFGVMQTLGVDITSGKEYTEMYLDRLSLGTWLTNNPNALAHTVIVALPLGYLLFFWRGSPFGKLFVFPAVAGVVAWCAVETESKGAFLVGGILCTLLFVIGQRWWVRVLVLGAATSVGLGVLKSLPRMDKMDDLRSDHGVQGRLLAWEQAKMTMEQNPTGVGWKQFMALIDWTDGNQWYFGIPKSTHSSYVQIGAELGTRGLVLWLLVLIVALRATWVFKAQNDTEERVRRSILLMLTAYMISGWMINREYHTEYFLLVAMAAAMHRLNVARSLLGSSDSTTVLQSFTLPWSPPPSWEVTISEKTPAEHAPVSLAKKLWNRINGTDLAVAFAATWAVIEFWQYILKDL